MNREHQINNSVLLANLNTCIDEEDITESIIEMSDKINKIESASGRSPHTFGMRKEVAKLVEKLTYSENQRKIHHR
jgi:hypothetical protein